MNNEELLAAIKERHSVRDYLDKDIDISDLSIINPFIEEVNKESGLHIQLITNSNATFKKFFIPYGRLNAYHFLAMVGPKSNDLEEKVGYYGEQLVLLAQQCSLNTCWVGGTYSKRNTKVKIKKGEKLVAIIAIGYGKNFGVPHKSKRIVEVSTTNDNVPTWYEDGVKAALLAPTALNQQKFKFTYNKNGSVSLDPGRGPYVNLDKGIVKYHFEVGANIKVNWK